MRIFLSECDEPVRNEVHSAPFHTTGESLGDGHVQILERHPISELTFDPRFGLWNSLSFLLRTDERFTFDAGHVPGIGVGQPTITK